MEETRLDLGSQKNFKLLTQLGGGNRNQTSAFFLMVFFFSQVLLHCRGSSLWAEPMRNNKKKNGTESWGRNGKAARVTSWELEPWIWQVKKKFFQSFFVANFSCSLSVSGSCCHTLLTRVWWIITMQLNKDAMVKWISGISELNCGISVSLSSSVGKTTEGFICELKGCQLLSWNLWRHHISHENNDSLTLGLWSVILWSQDLACKGSQYCSIV